MADGAGGTAAPTSERAAAAHPKLSHGVNGEFSDALEPGAVVFPWLTIGDVSKESLARPVIYPTKWPANVEAAMRRRGDAPLRVFADGVFDLCHFGHLRALEQAKKSFPNTYLIVGCCSDADTHKYKGQTVMTQEERYESLRHCRWVDEIVIDSPWVISEAFLNEHDIDFVCHDALPYADLSGASGCGDVYEPIKRMGKFHATQRTEGVSTSDLIIRIVKRYDDFVRRNLARGYSGAEMGVPFMLEKRMQLEIALGKHAAAAQAQLQAWGEVAEELPVEFLGLFSHDGPIQSTLRTVRANLGALLGGGSATSAAGEPTPSAAVAAADDDASDSAVEAASGSEIADAGGGAAAAARPSGSTSPQWRSFASMFGGKPEAAAAAAASPAAAAEAEAPPPPPLRSPDKRRAAAARTGESPAKITRTS